MGMETKLFSEVGEPAWMILISVGFMFFMGILLLMFFYFSKKKIHQKVLEKKNLELANQKNLLVATLEVQEKERKRIAEDLHDDISSKLNIVFLHCELLSKENLTKSEEMETINMITSLASKVLENARNIAHNLFPPVFSNFGLHAAVEELCGEFNRSKHVLVNYINNVQFNDTEKNRHLHVLRILQELMNNSLRHGEATEIEIYFDKEDDKTRCRYKDNGKGFDTENSKNQNGLGMRNIESRVNFLNGTLVIDSKRNEGMQAIFKF